MLTGNRACFSPLAQGKFVPEHEARVSIFDSSLMFGDMAFEMTRTFNGEAFCLR